MAVVSSARVKTLVEFSILESELTPEDREIHAEDVDIFLEVLWEESTWEGHGAYKKAMEDLPDEDYPWSAVRAREWTDADPTWSGLLKALVFAPPAMALALNRRPELEPELRGDELPDHDEESGYSKLYNAWFTWDTNMVLRSMGPVGWVIADDWDQVSEGAGAAAEEAEEDLEEVAEATKEVAEEAWEGAKDTAGEVLEGVKEAVIAGVADATWQLLKPIALVAGAIASVGVVGLVGYGVIVRSRRGS